MIKLNRYEDDEIIASLSVKLSRFEKLVYRDKSVP